MLRVYPSGWENGFSLVKRETGEMINIKPADGAGILSTKPLEGDTLILWPAVIEVTPSGLVSCYQERQL